MCRLSSWRWWRHIRGCRLLRTSLRAGMRFLAHFFCKMYFLYVCTWRKIWLQHFFAIFYPPKTQFFRTLRGLVPTLPELRCHLSSGKVFTVMSIEFYRNISCRIYGSKAVPTLPELRCHLSSGKVITVMCGARFDVLRANQHFLNYHQCNLETGRQEEAKYFRYVIVWSMICELQVFNYCNSGKHWGFYCKVSLGKPFVVSTCRRRNGFNLSHGISLVLDSDQSERLIMAEQRVWYSRNFLWLREVGCKELNTCSLISYFSGNERWKSGASGLVL